MKKVINLLLLLAFLAVVACTTHVHTVGKGPQSNEQISQRQWYILFGLIPLNTVNTNSMAGGATNYEVKTETSVVDIIIGIPASYISVSSRTVTVTK